MICVIVRGERWWLLLIGVVAGGVGVAGTLSTMLIFLGVQTGFGDGSTCICTAVHFGVSAKVLGGGQGAGSCIAVVVLGRLGRIFIIRGLYYGFSML